MERGGTLAASNSLTRRGSWAIKQWSLDKSRSPTHWGGHWTRLAVRDACAIWDAILNARHFEGAALPAALESYWAEPHSLEADTERELSGKPIPVNRVGLAVTLCLHQLNAARAIGRAYDAQFSGSD